MRTKHFSILLLVFFSTFFIHTVKSQSWAPLGVNDISSTTTFGNGVTQTNPNPESAPIDGQVLAMAANNTSHILYVGGNFGYAFNSIGGSVAASNVAQWTPTCPACTTTSPYTQGTWSALPGGGGISGGSATVTAMAYDATNGILYIGGSFTSAGGVAVTSLAQYTVSTHAWANVGSGVSGGSYLGDALIAGDNNAGCCPYYKGGGYPVMALTLDANNNLYVGGNFTTVGTGGTAVTAGCVAEFVPVASHNGTGTWYHLGASNTNQGVAGTQLDPSSTYKSWPTVYAINIDASGNVWIGGQFVTANGAGTTANNIAEWIPTGAGTGTWYALASGGGTGITGSYDGGAACCGEGPTAEYSECPAVLSLASFSGVVYAGGEFKTAGNTSVTYNLAQWTVSGVGTGTWSYVGTATNNQGVQNGALDGGEVTALLVYNSNLYIGGDFEDGGGSSGAPAYNFNAIAQWNGAAFKQMSSGDPGFYGSCCWVYALAALTGVGNGSYGILYAGGNFNANPFDYNGGTEMNNIAQWAGASTILPIDLLSFNVTYKKEERNVELDWATATETNNKSFTIERSANGTDWEIIEVLPGAGNSDKTINYSAQDENPLPGTSYYRLIQTDYDGSEHYSMIRAVTINTAVDKISVVPNPAGRTTSVIFNSAESDNAVVNIFDCMGKQVAVVPCNLIKGTNSIQINLSGYQSGVYIISLSTQQAQYTSKLVVAH